uniref:Uncharacterized protein n=1 Tax=Arundo donax TaxID=35708 RepID=A0A0A9HS34_ARUDO
MVRSSSMYDKHFALHRFQRRNSSTICDFFGIAGAHGLSLASSKLLFFTLFRSVPSPLSAKEVQDAESSPFISSSTRICE